MSKVIDIAGRKVGWGCPVFVSAEIGLNHNGDLDLALRTIDAAAQAGADAVKLQFYRVEEFLDTKWDTIKGPELAYISRGEMVVEKKWEMFRRFQIDRAFLAECAKRAEACGILWHATPTSMAGAAELVALNCPVLKNGSDFFNNVHLLQFMAATRQPVVISTGMDEDLGAVELRQRMFWEIDGSRAIFLHCVRSYPCPLSKVNLRRMVLMERVADLVGYSDHTMGIEAPLWSARLGACWIEKHFTLDDNLPGPDHWFSADPVQLRELVTCLRSEGL